MTPTSNVFPLLTPHLSGSAYGSSSCGNSSKRMPCDRTRLSPKDLPDLPWLLLWSLLDPGAQTTFLSSVLQQTSLDGPRLPTRAQGLLEEAQCWHPGSREQSPSSSISSRGTLFTVPHPHPVTACKDQPPGESPAYKAAARWRLHQCGDSGQQCFSLAGSQLLPPDPRIPSYYATPHKEPQPN